MPFEPDSQITTVLSSPEVRQTIIQPQSASIEIVLHSVQSIALTVTPPSQIETTLLIGQGPAGPPGPPGSEVQALGKSIEYESGRLSAVNLYSDAAKTSLVERRELNYGASGRLEAVQYFNSIGSLMFTRVLQYVEGVLVGTTTT